jgi:hypothetical protein
MNINEMNEAQLLEQKKAIEARIRELRDCGLTVGKCRIGREHYTTGKPDRWYLGIEVQTINREDRQSVSFRSIVNGLNRDDIVDAIPGIIRDLGELYKRARPELQRTISNSACCASAKAEDAKNIEAWS